MLVRVACPNCGESVHAPVQLEGKEQPCPKCGEWFRISPESGLPETVIRKKSLPKTTLGPHSNRNESLPKTTPLPPSVESSTWHVAPGSNTFGPISYQTLRLMAKEGQISKSSPVSANGTDWVPARDIPGLFEGGSRPIWKHCPNCGKVVSHSRCSREGTRCSYCGFTAQKKPEHSILDPYVLSEYAKTFGGLLLLGLAGVAVVAFGVATLLDSQTGGSGGSPRRSCQPSGQYEEAYQNTNDNSVTNPPSREQPPNRMADNASSVNPSDLTLEQRKAIFREGELALQDAEREQKRLGVWQAFRATNDPSEMDRLERICDQVDKKHLLNVCQRHGITYLQLCSIKTEAVLNNW